MRNIASESDQRDLINYYFVADVDIGTESDEDDDESDVFTTELEKATPTSPHSTTLTACSGSFSPMSRP